MPFFKRKQERSGRLDELAAHVKKIRRIAQEDPNGANALQSFLIEDGYWERQEVALQAQHEQAVTKAKPPEAPQAPAPPAAAPEAGVVSSNSSEQTQARSADDAVLEAELQRYLARIAEETEPDPDSPYYEDR